MENGKTSGPEWAEIYRSDGRFVKFHPNKLRLNLGYSEVESSYTTIQIFFTKMGGW